MNMMLTQMIMVVVIIVQRSTSDPQSCLLRSSSPAAPYWQAWGAQSQICGNVDGDADPAPPYWQAWGFITLIIYHPIANRIG